VHCAPFNRSENHLHFSLPQQAEKAESQGDDADKGKGKTLARPSHCFGGIVRINCGKRTEIISPSVDTGMGILSICRVGAPVSNVGGSGGRATFVAVN